MGGKGSGRPITNKCGTRFGYQQHYKRGESCQVCKDIYAAYKRSTSTYKRKIRRVGITAKDKYDYIVAAKLKAGVCTGGCGLTCTSTNMVIFEWDHLDPSTKRFTLADYRKHSMQSIITELAKCRLMCSNCHQAHTYEQRHYMQTVVVDTHKERQLSLFDMGLTEATQ